MTAISTSVRIVRSCGRRIIIGRTSGRIRRGVVAGRRIRSISRGITTVTRTATLLFRRTILLGGTLLFC